MRRVLRWTLPLSVAVAAALLLGSGFWLALRGGAGEPVGAIPTGTGPREELPAAVRILVLGDSLARGTGDASGRGLGGHLAELLSESGRRAPEVVNLAVNGARTRDLEEKLSRDNVLRIAATSEVVIVSIGGNDLFGVSITADGTLVDEAEDPREVFRPTLKRVEAIVGQLRGASPEARIYLIGLYDPFRERGRSVGPYVAIWNASLSESFSDDPNVTVVQTADLFTFHDRLSVDRFHPGEEAYRLIARRIADTL
ncbi:MAG TPA: GDSL-type esterase/lipase family protein [Thermoanaerobaculia bacterium]|nr:GDSL-type esterase/lipase family protein [Thermoanaerobaculia bacterium]